MQNREEIIKNFQNHIDQIKKNMAEEEKRLNENDIEKDNEELRKQY